LVSFINIIIVQHFRFLLLWLGCSLLTIGNYIHCLSTVSAVLIKQVILILSLQSLCIFINNSVLISIVILHIMLLCVLLLLTVVIH
jgi:hypothetical protein